MIGAQPKQIVADYLCNLARLAEAQSPVAVSDEINLLTEDALMYAYVMGEKQAAEWSKHMARVLIEGQLD